MRIILSLMLLCLLGAAPATAPRPASRPTSAPVGDALLSAAAKAADDAAFQSLRAQAEEQLRAQLGSLAKLDPDQTLRLATVRELARYFGSGPKLSAADRDTLRWLAAHKRLCTVLMMTVAEADAPDRVLATLSALRKDQGERLEDWPDLAAALCVVWDSRAVADGVGFDEAPAAAPAEDNTNRDRVLGLFRYYTGGRARLRFDLRTLPVDLAIYVVDVKLGPAELDWALDRYARRAGIGGVYFDVPYDDAVYYNGDARRIDGRPYTLPNLVKFGGICKDQAYFAAQVGKAFGVPSCECVGASGAGEGLHAWVGYLETLGRNTTWNFTTGRYQGMEFWSGAIADPQTHERLLDAEVGLLTELQNVSARDRLLSQALWKSRDLVEADAVVEVLKRAADLCPGNRRPWLSLGELGAEGKLSADQAGTVLNVLARFANGRYADLVFKVCQRMFSGQEPKEQVLSLEKAMKVLGARPDMAANIRLAQGDLLMKDNRRDEALAAYCDVLDKYLHSGPSVLDALEKVDAILRPARELARLLTIYRSVWTRMPVPQASAFVVTTPWYQVGGKYAALCDEGGDRNTANAARARMASMNTRQDN